MELLVPVGDFDKLSVAIENGADAVYLGVMQFNARLKAENFSFEKLNECVRIAHSAGVKVYVTLNTLIKNSEIDDFFKTVGKIYESNADAIILQEISLAKIINTNFPDMKIHASTQARLQNLENLKYIDRVILPRELSKKEIKDISKHGIDLEIFVQGALCFSVSGLCLMSSLIGQRSGNRGICAQPCRKKYNGRYLMSMKDLSLIGKLDSIEKIGVKSIKIEGRLRSERYLRLVTQIYRKSLDGEKITKKDLEILNSSFTRELTTGFFSDSADKTGKHNVYFEKIRGEIYSYVNNKKPINIKRKKIIPNVPEIKNLEDSKKIGFHVKLYNIKDIELANKSDYVENVFYYIDNEDVLEARKISNKKFYVYLPTLINDSDIEKYIAKVREINPDGVLINSQNVSQHFSDYDVIHDYGLNVFNDYDLKYYGKSIISPELSFKDLSCFKNKNFLTLVHGNLNVMTTKNPLPKKLKYDERFTFPVVQEKDYFRVLNSRQIGLLDKILLLKDAGITQYYFDLSSRAGKWLDIYTRIINGEKLNFKKIGKGLTFGHFDKGV
jgi:collagenase-like PrtC family protease